MLSKNTWRSSAAYLLTESRIAFSFAMLKVTSSLHEFGYLLPAHFPSINSTQHQQVSDQCRDCDQSVDGSLPVDRFPVNAEPGTYLPTAIMPQGSTSCCSKV
jgi:hypothetical protein